jgi:RNA polymerase sigma-B factor
MRTPTQTGRRVLTREQRRDRTARALAAAARSRSAARREALLDYVVCINMEVAREIASRYGSRGIDSEDLAQVAYVALTRATRSFQPERDNDFLAYAVPSIRGELKKHFRDYGWAIRPPRRIQDAQFRIARAEGELAQLLGRSPKPSELAAHLGLDLQEVIEAMSADGCFLPSSLDRPVLGGGGHAGDGDGPATMAELLREEDGAHEAAEARVTLAPLVRRLEARDQQILYLRFVEGRTQQEIGSAIGVTQMQVSRLLSRILRDLRCEIESTQGCPGP